MRLTGENVGDYAETLARQVRPGGYVLDYSEASLAALDALLANSDAQMQDPAFPEMQRSLVVFYNGCYLGEVMARNLGGAWRFAENWADSTLLFPYGDGGIETRPFLKVWRRVSEGPLENELTAYYAGLKERLAADPADAP